MRSSVFLERLGSLHRAFRDNEYLLDNLRHEELVVAYQHHTPAERLDGFCERFHGLEICDSVRARVGSGDRGQGVAVEE